MSWFFLSLGCAFTTATTAAISKILLRKKRELFVGWLIFAFSIPFLFLVILFLKPGFHTAPGFWQTVAMLLPLEILALFLYMKALKISPLSVTFPFIGLTPVFSILTSFFILGERLTPLAIAGVCLVSLGAYALEGDALKKGPLGPLRSIWKEKGSVLMIIVAFIYSFSATLGKRAVMLSGPVSFPFMYYGIIAVMLMPVAYAENKRSEGKFQKSDILLAVCMGMLFCLSMLFHFRAILLTNVSHMIAVKRLSLLISVVYGGVIFKEKYIKDRLVGSLIMLCGVALLALGG
jgi:drug/metabolite transporter (DMT)-like permease